MRVSECNGVGRGDLRVCPFPWPTWLWGEREKDRNFTSSPFLWESLHPARSPLGNTGLERAQGLSVINQGKVLLLLEIP